jgi:large subunit ribosomal protein L32e
MKSEKERLLKIRKKISQKRPDFVQFEAWRYKKLKNKWKRPRGIDNKMRQKKKGWPRSVKVGWRSPKAVRDLHPTGFEEVMIYNPGDITLIDPKTQVGRIGGTVGGRKRVKILEEAERLGVHILNPGMDMEYYLEKEEDEEIVEEKE